MPNAGGVSTETGTGPPTDAGSQQRDGSDRPFASAAFGRMGRSFRAAGAVLPNDVWSASHAIALGMDEEGRMLTGLEWERG